MSTIIDENVVKMTFDNKEFNQNIDESEKKLDELKDVVASVPSQIAEIDDKTVSINVDTQSINKDIEVTKEKSHELKAMLKSIPVEVLTAFKEALSKIDIASVLKTVAVITGMNRIRRTVSAIGDSIHQISLQAVRVVTASCSAILARMQLTSSSISSLLRGLSIISGISFIKNAILGLGQTIEGTCLRTVALAKNAVGAVINQIKTGGWQRAMNIENAKFQLEGLKLDVDTFMEAAKYAVDGTAYGLDAAAKAASQLGASGVTSFEKLKYSLRGISGVAAMTNSSYEEISHIFTTVAGNGRLMSDQLQSLSSRGINAAATLAQELGKTEGEIRDMVSKGKIDFDTFASAMDSAFGEHAKDANKTFTGSLSNIKAALNKIGEAFATPILQNMINIFNNTRLAINAFKKELEDNGVFESFDKNFTIVAEKGAKLIEWLTDAISETPFVARLSDVLKNMFETVAQIVDTIRFAYGGEIKQIFANIAGVFLVVNDIFKGLKASVEESFGAINLTSIIEKLLTNITFVLSFLQDIDDVENSIKETLKSWFVILEDIVIVFRDIFGFNRNAIQDFFKNAVQFIGDFFKSLKLTDDETNKVHRIIIGVASALWLIKDTALKIFDVIKPVFSLVRPLIDDLLTIGARIADLVTNLRNMVKEQGYLNTFWSKAKDLFQRLVDMVNGVRVNFMDIFFGEGFKDKSILDKIIEFFKKTFSGIGDFFSNLKLGDLNLEPIQKFLNNLTNLGFSDAQFEATSKFLGSAGKIFDEIAGFFKEKATTEKANRENSSKEKDVTLLEVINNALSIIKDVLKIISDFLNDVPIEYVISFTLIIERLFKSIERIIKALAFALVAIMALDTIKTIATKPVTVVNKLLTQFGPGSLIEKMRLLMIQVRKLSLNNLLHGNSILVNILTALDKLMKTFMGFITLTAMIPIPDLIKALAVFGILVTVVALLVVGLGALSSELDGLKDKESKGSIMQRIGEMTQMTEIDNREVSGFNKLADAFIQITQGILLIGIAFGIMAKSVGNVGETITTTVALVSLIGCVVIIMGAMYLMKKDGMDPKDIEAGAFALVIISASMLIMAKAFKNIAKTIKGLEYDQISIAIIAFVAILGSMVALMFALGKLDPKTALIGSSALAVIAISVSILIASISSALAKIATLDPQGLIVGGIIIGILTALVLGLSALLVGLASSATAALPVLGIIGLVIVACAVTIGMVAAFASSVAKILVGFRELFDYMSQVDGEKIKKVINNIEVLCTETMLKLIEGAGKILPALGDYLKNKLVPFVITLLNETIPQIIVAMLTHVAQVFDALIQYGPTALDKVIEFLNELLYGFDGRIDEIKARLSEIVDGLLGDIYDWLYERVPFGVNKIFELFMRLLESIATELTNNKEEIQEKLTDIFNVIADIAEWVIENTEIKDRLDKIGHDLVAAILGGAKRAVNEELNPFLSRIGEGVGVYHDFNLEVDDTMLNAAGVEPVNSTTTRTSGVSQLNNNRGFSYDFNSSYSAGQIGGIGSGYTDYTKDLDYKNLMTKYMNSAIEYFGQDLQRNINPNIEINMDGDATRWLNIQTNIQNQRSLAGW